MAERRCGMIKEFGAKTGFPPNKDDFWRIFHCKPTTDLQNLPKDTSLRRNFITYLQQGNPMGVGLGVLLFDGEKIINL